MMYVHYHFLNYTFLMFCSQVIGSRRASWRIISSIEQKGESDKLNLIQNYKGKIEKELEDICSDILDIIKNELIPNTESEEGKVFYHKMKGDYHRYLAEFQTADVRKESAALALEGNIVISLTLIQEIRTCSLHPSINTNSL